MFFGRGYNGIDHCFERFGIMPGGSWLFLIYLAVIVITITVVLLVNRNKRGQSVNTLDSRAIDELKLLYARGEISEEEYMKRKNFLSK